MGLLGLFKKGVEKAKTALSVDAWLSEKQRLTLLMRQDIEFPTGEKGTIHKKITIDIIGDVKEIQIKKVEVKTEGNIKCTTTGKPSRIVVREPILGRLAWLEKEYMPKEE